MSEPPFANPASVLMRELAANLEAVIEHTLEQIQKPPAGAITDVGHFRVLNGLKRKEQEALEQLLEDVVYNSAATILAMLDGQVEGEGAALPKVSVRVDDEESGGVLLRRFAEAWEGEA